MTANRDMYDHAVNRAAMLRLHEAKLHSDIDEIVNEHAERVTHIVSRQKYKELTPEAQRFAQEGLRHHRKSLLSLFKDQAADTLNSLKAAAGAIWTARPVQLVDTDLILDRPIYNEKTLAEIWSDLSLNDRKRIEQMIRGGLASGQSEAQLSRQLRRVFRLTTSQSKAITTTAMTSVVAQADREVYRANAKSLRGWQYVAVLDSRTTSLCAARDGHIYDIEDTAHLPPAHYNCRSKTVPVFKSWEDMAKLEGVAEVKRRNVRKLTEEQRAYYDGLTPLRENYSDWLRRQPREVQERHLGTTARVELFASGKLSIDKFFDPKGRQVGIKELRSLSNSAITRFEAAKRKLDNLHLPFTRPSDITPEWRQNLADYFALQAGDLGGQLAATNYRGVQMATKQMNMRNVKLRPPREDQLVFNPVTRRYEDSRMYQPNPVLYQRMVERLEELSDSDKALVLDVDKRLDGVISLNERTVVMDNLRTLLTRYRKDPSKGWGNFKAVVQSELKFDIMNFSDAMETQVRRRTDVLKKLTEKQYIDPVLGAVDLQELHDKLIDNIFARNKWEDRTAPILAVKFHATFTPVLAAKHPLLWKRVSDRDLQRFYLKFVNRLSMADTPDRDQLAVQLGRDLFNLANFNGSRKEWYNTGLDLLNSKAASKYYSLETFGVQKRRMRNKLSGQYYGPFYDTQSWNIRVTDKSLLEYADLSRKIDVGMRIGELGTPRLLYREGYKTYWTKSAGIWRDTRIPITSTSSFSTFPAEVVDADMVNALSWTSKTRYKIDKDYHSFIKSLLEFRDDKGKAEYYDNLNTYRAFITARGDAYDRLKVMDWLDGRAFSNPAFIDHRGRVYERGFIGPQAGETFRPFLNSEKDYLMTDEAYRAFQDQIGGFMGGLSDFYEGKFDSLTSVGRQQIAEKLRPDMVRIGNHILRGKPADIRAILDDPFVAEIEGEDLGKFYRLALEVAKIERHTGGNMKKLLTYRTSLVLEQDASSSGAQIIALTTRNKQLAELSNVVPTNRKKRLYDEIAIETFNDPRFKLLNERLGLTERDLKKAAKAQNMVTLYGAGTRTGIMNVERKLSKALSTEGTLVLKAAERDAVLSEISAQAARYDRFDKDTADDLRRMRKTVKDIFDNGLEPGEELMEELWFLQPETRTFVEKMTGNYERVVTPKDFAVIGNIMSEYLQARTPILMDFTKFFGRLAEDYLLNAKPSKADYDWQRIAKYYVFGGKRGSRLPLPLTALLGVKEGSTVNDLLFSRFGFWKPGGNLHDLISGVEDSRTRAMGGKYFKISAGPLGKLWELSLFKANKLPKTWTTVPWVNFDGKVLEQHYSKVIEQRLTYKDSNGNWNTNILQVPTKTEATWWEELTNASGKINDVADPGRARTAFGVNGNHSNDAVIVKRFHLWGQKTGVATSSVHDAFVTKLIDMPEAKRAIRQIYADSMKRNVVKAVLDEMKARGLPKEVYDKYLEEAIAKGLIPVPGKSRINGRLLTEEDILTAADVLKPVQGDFRTNIDWYGIGP